MAKVIINVHISKYILSRKVFCSVLYSRYSDKRLLEQIYRKISYRKYIDIIRLSFFRKLPKILSNYYAVGEI